MIGMPTKWMPILIVPLWLLEGCGFFEQDLAGWRVESQNLLAKQETAQIIYTLNFIKMRG